MGEHRLRVAHVGRLRSEGRNGIDKTIAGIVSNLGQTTVEPEVWHFTHEESRITKRRADGVLVFTLPLWKTRSAQFLSLPPRTRRFLQSRVRQVDVLHLHSVFVAANLWAARLGLPYILTPNGGYSRLVLSGRRRVLKRGVMAVLEKKLVDGASFIHAVSDSEARQLRELFPQARIVTVPNGIDDRLFSQVTPDLPGRPCWGFLGRLSLNQKGLDLLLEGYGQAKSSGMAATLPRLTLAGPPKEDSRVTLEAILDRWGIRGEVDFRGALNGLAKWEFLSSLSLFIHTSRWEGMPFAVLEALSLGRPVLVTPETNIAGYVEKYGAGWVAEGTPSSIASVLTRIASVSEEELKTRGEAARQLAFEEFRWSSLAPRIARLYREVIC